MYYTDIFEQTKEIDINKIQKFLSPTYIKYDDDEKYFYDLYFQEFMRKSALSVMDIKTMHSHMVDLTNSPHLNSRIRDGAMRQHLNVYGYIPPPSGYSIGRELEIILSKTALHTNTHPIDIYGLYMNLLPFDGSNEYTAKILWLRQNLYFYEHADWWSFALENNFNKTFIKQFPNYYAYKFKTYEKYGADLP